VTAKSLTRRGLSEHAAKLRAIAADNAQTLRSAIDYCARHHIGCFRVNSQILPLRTHPKLGYDADLLGEDVVAEFRACKRLARRAGIRISFHPDQFVVLSSPDPRVVASSLEEIEYQAEVAEWIGADVINVHGGGGYGDKPAALKRLVDAVQRLSDCARKRLTLENDDRTYTPSDLLPVCGGLELPLAYDVHHHRCNGDGLDVETVTELAASTWDREPLFHVSSPRGGWRGESPRCHADYIDLRDFPGCWESMDLTVEVEAKAKELAVRKLARALERRSRRRQAIASSSGQVRPARRAAIRAQSGGPVAARRQGVTT
jgi:UV DNA damage endonuclease